MSGMNENAGSVHLSTLDQAAFWIDCYRILYALGAKTQGYLENDPGHLRRTASTLYSLELRRKVAGCSSELTGGNPDRDRQKLSRGKAAAEERFWENRCRREVRQDRGRVRRRPGHVAAAEGSRHRVLHGHDAEHQRDEIIFESRARHHL